MKKVMILLAVLLTANVMMAQKKDRTDAYMYNKNAQYDKAMVSIEKCVNHEQFLGMKPKDQATAWHYRAIIYQNVIDSKNPELIALAGDAEGKVFESLTNCMKDEGYLNDNKADIYQRVAVVMNNYYQRVLTLTMLPILSMQLLHSKRHTTLPSCFRILMQTIC